MAEPVFVANIGTPTQYGRSEDGLALPFQAVPDGTHVIMGIASLGRLIDIAGDPAGGWRVSNDGGLTLPVATCAMVRPDNLCGLVHSGGAIIIGLSAAAATPLQIMRTTDGGVTCATITVDAARTNDAFQKGTLWEIPSSGVIYGVTAGSPLRIYRSLDAGLTWSNVYESPFVNTESSGGVYGNVAYVLHAIPGAVLSRCRLLRSPNSGLTWSVVYEPANVHQFDANFRARNALARLNTDQTLVFYTNQNSDDITQVTRRHRSLDNGATWGVDTVNLPPGKPFGVTSTLAAVWVHADVAGNTLFRSTDGGVSWTNMASIKSGSANASGMYMLGAQGPSVVAISPVSGLLTDLLMSDALPPDQEPG